MLLLFARSFNTKAQNVGLLEQEKMANQPKTFVSRNEVYLLPTGNIHVDESCLKSAYGEPQVGGLACEHMTLWLCNLECMKRSTFLLYWAHHGGRQLPKLLHDFTSLQFGMFEKINIVLPTDFYLSITVTDSFQNYCTTSHLCSLECLKRSALFSLQICTCPSQWQTASKITAWLHSSAVWNVWKDQLFYFLQISPCPSQWQ